MSSGVPLYSTSQKPNSSSGVHLRIGSLSCLSPTSSFPHSNSEETTPIISSEIEEEDDFVNCLPSEDLFDRPTHLPKGKQFFSADARFFPQHPLGCPARERRRMVSWGGAMDLKEKPNIELSRSPSQIQGRSRRSHRSRCRSDQFEDNLSHEDNPRLIYINDPKRTNDKYEFTGNEICTSKYTVITFLPKNLFIQFRRVAYLYFLAIVVLNQLPPLAVFGRTVSLFPLLFVLCVTAVKDGYEDWRRHRSDKKENNREALVLNGGEFQLKKWKNIQVGEILKIFSNETLPCDMVLLGSSDPGGIAYIQTMNLDGESNLKTRYARQETASQEFEGDLMYGLIRCEQPNRNIYEFTANMEFKGRTFPLSQLNTILRGCQLKNTDWIVGVVVYAGQETKAMMNSAASPSKRSRLEGHMNRETLWLSVFLLVMCLTVALGMCLWLKRHEEQLDTLPYYRRIYFKGDKKLYKYYGIPMETLFSFLSSIIVFQIMIPISLYITMELVRLGQSYFMIGDNHMYDSSSDSRFQCRSLNINEDLGQIRYVFSDKTGTLTENKMEFRRASVFGKNYGCSLPIIEPNGPAEVTSHRGNRRWKLKSEIAIDKQLMSLLHTNFGGDERIAAHEFFLALAACNTVIPIFSSCHSSSLVDQVDAIDYQGESPDEQSLVSAAATYGYTLCERTSGHIVIEVNGDRQRLDVLGMHEFDSVRKRMSVVVKLPSGAIKVFVKGADTSMFSILAVNSEWNDRTMHETQSHLLEYSSQGLRTLVIGARDLSEAEFYEWQSSYEDASTSLSDRSVKLRHTASLIENNLTLLGATGIEDKLQDGVPEAIESLRQAGIKVWVLTGDKQETAISIGLSCKLITPDMQQIIINGKSEEECRHLLTEYMEKYGVKSSNYKHASLKHGDNNEIEHLDAPHRLKSAVGVGGQSWREGLGLSLALVIDGNSLVYILEKDLESQLFDLATACRVVLCCRVAPLQKAGIVDLVKSRTDDMTLAIGDGANDVSMIQMADVGVGICGQEGRQAVMASDFAMGQFRFLKRLLLVHGHWNYQRVGYLVLYNFYRNAVFVMMLFWYILYSAFSTTSAITDWSSVLYAVIYTSIPTIVVGILDKDLSDKTLLQYPKLYCAGYRHESYNLKLFWLTMVDTFWQSLVLFYIPLSIYKNSSIDIWSLGSLWTIAVVILVNIHLAMDIRRWLLLTHLAVWGSILITYACVVALDCIPSFPNYWTIFHLMGSPTYWLTILLIIVVALLPRFLLKVLHQTFWPSDIQIAREAEILKDRDDFLGYRQDQNST
ncbi:unnamed protein product [Rhodiola kirilowii]